MSEPAWRDLRFKNGDTEESIRVNKIFNEIDEKSLKEKIADFAGGTIIDKIIIKSSNGVRLGLSDLYFAQKDDEPLNVVLIKTSGKIRLAQLLDVEMPTFQFLNMAKSLTKSPGTEFPKSLSLLDTEGESEYKKFNDFIDQQTDLLYKPLSLKKGVNIKSEADLSFQINSICAKVLSKRIFNDKIQFCYAPNAGESNKENQQKNLEENTEKKPENPIGKINGDQFFFLNDDPYKTEIFIAEFKTPGSMPIVSNGEVSTIIEAYYGNDSCSSISSIRARCLIQQVYIYMTLQLKTNPEGQEIYALLSNYETTFLIKLCDDNIWISRPFPSQFYLRLTFFVVVSNLRHLSRKFEDSNLKAIFVRANQIFEESQFKTPRILQNQMTSSSKHQMITRSKSGNDEFTDAEKLDEKKLFHAWLNTGSLLGFGYSAFVTRVKYGKEVWAIKMCDMYNHNYGALEQIENEAMILEWLATKNTNFHPKIKFFGVIAIYKSIVMTLINGQSYDEFHQLSMDEKCACLNTLAELHKLKVLHGDIRAQNFIFQTCITENRQETKAFLVDFGLAKLNGNQNELLQEKLNLVREMRFKREEVKNLFDWSTDI